MSPSWRGAWSNFFFFSFKEIILLGMNNNSIHFFFVFLFQSWEFNCFENDKKILTYSPGWLPSLCCVFILQAFFGNQLTPKCLRHQILVSILLWIKPNQSFYFCNLYYFTFFLKSSFSIKNSIWKMIGYDFSIQDFVQGIHCNLHFL